MVTDWQEKKSQLLQELSSFVHMLQRQRRWAAFLNAILIVLALICSFGVTFFGLGENGVVAALLGSIITLLIAMSQAFAFGEKADFYQVILADAENLLTSLQLGVDSEEAFEETMRKFLVLRKYAAQKLPRGKGMEAIRGLSAEMTASERAPS